MQSTTDGHIASCDITTQHIALLPIHKSQISLEFANNTHKQTKTATINTSPLTSREHYTPISPVLTTNSAEQVSIRDNDLDASKPSPPQAGWWSILVADTWILEAVAGFISFASFASIFGVLSFYDNKPVPPMLKGITLNAVISFLATISRTSIMFCVGTVLSQGKWLWFRKERSLIDLQMIEGASRGPLGSILLLSKFNSGLKLSIAAALTVVTLGFDPFVQQLLTAQNLPVQIPTTGVSINAAISLDRTYAFESAETDAQMATAILAETRGSHVSDASLRSRNAIGSSDTIGKASVSPLEPICVSGNCIWNPYHALDVCMKCRDTTSEMTFKSTSADPELVYQNVTNHVRQGEDLRSYVYYSENITWNLIPKYGRSQQIQSRFAITRLSVFDNDNASILLESSMVRKAVWPLNNVYPILNNVYSDYDTWTPGQFAGIKDPAAAIGFAEFERSTIGTPVLNKSLECALTYCVKLFNRSVVENTLRSDTLSETYGTINKIGSIQRLVWSGQANDTKYNAYISDGYMVISKLLEYVIGNSTYHYRDNFPLDTIDHPYTPIWQLETSVGRISEKTNQKVQINEMWRNYLQNPA